MIRRIVLAILVVLCGLGWPPAWADYGGEWSAEEPIEAKITLEIHPLHAQVWLDGFWLGTALDGRPPHLGGSHSRPQALTASPAGPSDPRQLSRGILSEMESPDPARHAGLVEPLSHSPSLQSATHPGTFPARPWPGPQASGRQ